MINKISLILAESGLEIIPIELRNNRLIINYSKKVCKPVSQILLDKSYHYSAMKQNSVNFIWKRGRPDIVHLCMMSILSTPLFFTNGIKVYVHTIDNKVIFIGEKVRIPKSYKRFEGLMIKLFHERIIKENEKNDKMYLLKLEQNMSFDILLNEIIKPDKVIGFSSRGLFKSIKNIVDENIETNNENIAFVIGGFQSGEFSQDMRDRFNMTYAIANYQLEAHVVISRLVYECENRLSYLSHPF